MFWDLRILTVFLESHVDLVLVHSCTLILGVGISSWTPTDQLFVPILCRLQHELPGARGQWETKSGQAWDRSGSMGNGCFPHSRPPAAGKFLPRDSLLIELISPLACVPFVPPRCLSNLLYSALNTRRLTFMENQIPLPSGFGWLWPTEALSRAHKRGKEWV